MLSSSICKSLDGAKWASQCIKFLLMFLIARTLSAKHLSVTQKKLWVYATVCLGEIVFCSYCIWLLFICAYVCVSVSVHCGCCTVRAVYPMDLIDWTKCNTKNNMYTKVRHTHKQNECDRDGQQRRLYASIEQININVHWMEIWQHIFLSDNMKYGNSPQHSTDS